MRTTRFDPIICPELNREISRDDCYESSLGFNDILAEMGIEGGEAIKTCKFCEARKPKSDEIV